MSKVSPTKAIKLECKYCLNGERISQCNTKVCKLDRKVFQGSALKRIKAHCLDCVCGTHYDVKACDGKLLDKDINDGTCFLHPFRLGKNPFFKKRILTENEKDVLRERLNVRKKE